MGILDRLRGAGVQRPVAPASEASADEQAIERYRYLLRTAPPETIEQAHAEAFAQLTPEQRRRVLASLADAVPERARGTTPPRSRARPPVRSCASRAPWSACSAASVGRPARGSVRPAWAASSPAGS